MEINGHRHLDTTQWSGGVGKGSSRARGY